MGISQERADRYLEIILECEEDGVAPIRTSIAERVGLKPQSIHRSIGEMIRNGLIVEQADRTLRPSLAARVRAIRRLRRHRLAEYFLVQTLSLPWASAHAEAKILENAISDRIEGRLLKILGHPQRPPYGKPIPFPNDTCWPANSYAESETLVRVTDRNVFFTYVDIVSINDTLQGDRETLVRLANLGVRPGARGSVQGSGSSLHLQIEGEIAPAELTRKEASQITVTETGQRSLF